MRRLSTGSTILLFGSAATATALIFYFVLRAYIRERRVFRFYRPAVLDRRFADRMVEKPV